MSQSHFPSADDPAPQPAGGPATEPSPPGAAPAFVPDPAVCSRCGAVHAGGRWRWEAAPAGAAATVCDACRRLETNLPAGYVMVEGPYAEPHGAELVEEVTRLARLAAAVHPLRRLMAIERSGDHLLATTTDVELAHDIAHALRQAHGGTVEGHFDRARQQIRLRWVR